MKNYWFHNAIHQGNLVNGEYFGFKINQMYNRQLDYLGLVINGGWYESYNDDGSIYDESIVFF